MSTIICFEVEGQIVCEREEDRARRELEERLRKYIEDKLKELLEQHEVEITFDITTGKGVGKWRRKQF